MKNIRIKPEWRLILVLALIKLALHFFTNTNYGLHRDAFLYLALGDHLDFGYVAVPPFIAVIARLTIVLFGDSVFAVRLLPAVIGATSVVIIGLIVRVLGGKTWAILLACATFIVSPAFLRSNTLFQPVSFNQFFWLLAMYFAIKLVQTQNPKFWLHIGIVCGLAFLNKYSIAFLVLAFLFALLLTPDRKLIQSKFFLYGLLTGILIILPNLVWQYNHNWPVVTHMLTLQCTQLVNVNIKDFLVAQMLMNLPGLFIWMFGLVFLLFLKQGKKYRFLGYTFVSLLLILLLLSGKPYYTLGIYTPLFAVGGYAIERYFWGKWRLIKPVILAFMVVIAMPVLPYSLPEPVSFNASFLFWAPDSLDIETLIYINHELGEDIVYYFAEVQVAGRMANPYARESGLPVFVCREPRNDFARFYREKVKRLKERYRRR